MFGSRVGFSRSVRLGGSNGTTSGEYKSKMAAISNDHISGMSYPIHFHELQSSLEEQPTGENNARGVIRLVTI